MKSKISKSCGTCAHEKFNCSQRDPEYRCKLDDRVVKDWETCDRWTMSDYYRKKETRDHA